MTEIKPPPRPDDYASRALDCEFSMEPAFQALARQAQEAGWTEDDVASALIALAMANMRGIIADRKSLADMRSALKGSS